MAKPEKQRSEWKQKMVTRKDLNFTNRLQIHRYVMFLRIVDWKRMAHIAL